MSGLFGVLGSRGGGHARVRGGCGFWCVGGGAAGEGWEGGFWESWSESGCAACARLVVELGMVVVVHFLLQYRPLGNSENARW